MHKSAGISGSLGDCIYSLQTLKKLGVTTLYVKEANFFPPYGNLHSAVKRLIEMQGIECLPTSGDYPVFQFEPGLKINYNLDLFRKQGGRGRNHLIYTMLKTFNLSVDDWKLPLLKVDGERSHLRDVHSLPYDLIHLTPRWREGSKVDWSKVFARQRDQGRLTYFIGFESEYLDFVEKYGGILYLACADLLEMAILIRDCERLICNQSCSLAIAQGLGKEYYCDFKPERTNTRMYTKNEHCL